jgi:hypothetical protein
MFFVNTEISAVRLPAVFYGRAGRSPQKAKGAAHMPGMITHYLCAEAVLPALPGQAREIIAGSRGLYQVGAQGPDIFFYYPPGFLTMGGIGSLMHKGGVSAFMAEAAAIIKAVDGNRKAAVLSYIAGYITHYCLDRAAHPYIYYKSGFPARGERAIKFSVAHRRFETAVDVLMLAGKKGEKPKDRRLWKMVRLSRKEADGVPAALSVAIYRAYGAVVTPRQIMRAVVFTRLFTRAAQSRKGRRKRFLAQAERIIDAGGVCSSLIHPQEAGGGKDLLNLANAPWKLPYDETSVMTDSFPELFDKAVNSAESMITALFDHACGKLSVPRFLEIIGDDSLTTGAPASMKLKFTIHEKS